MSLVAYGSSDESSDEDENPQGVESLENLVKKTRTVLNLPAPKEAVDSVTQSEPGVENDELIITRKSIAATDEPMLFKNLPKPKHVEIGGTNEAEEDVIPREKDAKEKSLRKNRAPVKISLPSLSDFKDVDEEQEQRKKNRLKPSEKGTGLFSILPPPKGSATKATIRSLIPDAVKKGIQPSSSLALAKRTKTTPAKAADVIKKITPLAALNYDSDSEDESGSTNDGKLKAEGKVDFFSLENSDEISLSSDNSGKEFLTLLQEPEPASAGSKASCFTLDTRRENSGEMVSQTFVITEQNEERESGITGFATTREGAETFDKTLTSNVINLPKEEIRMKNKAEVGPKLPIPEQEYNVDSQGNVAFDEKAIEYLCGKRGVKRKNKDFDEANIIEINGEDIKPDEREWLVKALTEEPAERPVSMESAGPSTQSRKKHQITYLAHQAKAMEVELKNQWAQNRVTRKQTQSKYGF